MHLKIPHPEVPFSNIGDDTIAALTKLAEIFKTKFQKVQTPGLSNAPAKAVEEKNCCQFIQSTFGLSRYPTAPNKITNVN
jgi:hypothetical protein